jgi:hypothetical protein
MTVRRAKLYTLEQRDILVSKNDYEVFKVDMSKRPFRLTNGEWATTVDSKVEIDYWPVETVQIDGQHEYVVLSPHLREYLSLPFREQLDRARSDARDSRKICAIQKEFIRDLEAEIKRLRAPWYVRAWRALTGDA